MLVAQFPSKFPTSDVIAKLPELSKPKSLLALSVADVANSVDVSVLPFVIFIDRSTPSWICWVIKVNRSKASSWEAAGKGSFST